MEEQVEALMAQAEQGANARFTIDLEANEITAPDGTKIAFEIDPFRRHCLLNGLDDIGLTLEREASITGFEDKQKTSQPWL